MSGTHAGDYDHVGPILLPGVESEAIVEAIKDMNRDARVIDRGAYIRVLIPGRCVVSRQAIEQHLGRAFRFPGDLEKNMSGFKGTLSLSEEEAVWQFASTT